MGLTGAFSGLIFGLAVAAAAPAVATTVFSCPAVGVSSLSARGRLLMADSFLIGVVLAVAWPSGLQKNIWDGF